MTTRDEMERTVDELGIVRYDGFVSIRESIEVMIKQQDEERANRLYDAMKDEFYYENKVKEGTDSD